MFCSLYRMFPAWLLVLLATVVTGRATVQSYLGSGRVQHASAGGSVLSDDNRLGNGPPGRRWDVPVDKESTSSLIFESVGSLLQTWGNTRRRNGEQLG